MNLARQWQFFLAVFMWIVGVFGIWRNMRKEVLEEEIFKLGYVLGIATFSGWWVAVNLRIGMEWWGALLGGLASLALFTRIKKWSVWEWADCVIPIFFYIFLAMLFIQMSFWAMGVGLVGLVAITQIGRHYRRFSWYKSGKPGLVALTALFSLAAMLLTVAFFDKSAIYWGNLSLSQWLGVSVIAASFAEVYIRSEQTVFEEIWQKIKALRKPIKK